MDNLFGNADVGLIGIGIFKGKGIREVGIEQDTPPILDNEEAALAKPPDAAPFGVDDAPNIGEEGIVFLESGFHSTQPKFPANNPDPFYHILELLLGCPAGRLAKAAVGGEGKFFRSREF